MYIKNLFQGFKKLASVSVICGFACNIYADTSIHRQADAYRLNGYLDYIIAPYAFRNYENTKELDRVAAYLKKQIEQFSIPCEYQPYQVEGKTYRNVVCHLQTGNSKKVIIGAHYDVYGNFKGADDNASGVAGVIETARILAANKTRLKHNVDFVFYTLEEPPYFRTEHMGSYVHAQSILNEKSQIQAVYILEMIGYFDHKEIQEYPSGLGLFYPKHGNFIGAVSNFSSRHLGEKYCDSMKDLKRLDCQRLVAPSFVKGIDFSDHMNYWNVEIPAIMITDTAFFRNKHYHTKDDTVEKLNVNKMTDVINGVVYSLLEKE
ncbi:M28 family peptidase [Acinetobacter sichuanensis]|uniref:M20/M25/M40 family metallo-hydrolase n=1 Tax=Acinetobacter sichuanensis TaxID=2136183 RepID=A0A371YU03_9GAMM|nr:MULTISPECIES: M20/M25/M40 family metallo-hydrolase [Acinetobacter]MDM1763446.1 M20/M25/M40 family metallo-hydrolase [Acinetobacter sp. 226-1]MDM1766925.1 M20/M25/M40 family metallo-hydrolase [Acinetobacter sp. 226-4]RFC84943.1 M20/M25/M40 family metallo-hydrolase [Acinetobacter sichuanensis]